MATVGFENSIANNFITANEVIETPQQIVLFLVREVLSPELREELELDKEFPEDSIKEFAKLGIREQLARRIWAAHWTLPSINQMQTALHRYAPQNRKFWEKEVVEQGLDPNKVVTSVNDISQLLKFQDVGTRYREQVLSTLFNDVGQIQLRWLIRFRFLNFDQAVYRHERQGLPKTIATIVTKVVFVVQSITDWKTAISKGAMTFDDVLVELAEWHIFGSGALTNGINRASSVDSSSLTTDDNIIRIIKLKVSGEIAEGVEDERKLTKSLILDAFDLGKTSRSETLQNLQDLNYSIDQANFIFEVNVEKESIRKEKQIAKGDLTNSEIKKAFRNDKISFDEAVDRLVNNGKLRNDALIIMEIERDSLG